MRLRVVFTVVRARVARGCSCLRGACCSQNKYRPAASGELIGENAISIALFFCLGRKPIRETPAIFDSRGGVDQEGINDEDPLPSQL